MTKTIQDLFPSYDPRKHSIAIYTPSADLAHWVAERLRLDRSSWFYQSQGLPIYGRRNLLLLLYGPYWERPDFPDFWQYWTHHMPADCQSLVLEESDLGE